MDDLVPGDISSALAESAVADAFAHLPPSHRREYLTWIAEAKRPETRVRRIAQTIDRLGGAKDNR